MLMIDIMVEVVGSELECISVDPYGTLGDLKAAIHRKLGIPLERFDIVLAKCPGKGLFETAKLRDETSTSTASSILSNYSKTTRLSDIDITDGDTVKVMQSRRERALQKLQHMGLDRTIDEELLYLLFESEQAGNDRESARKLRLLLEAGAKAVFENTTLLHHTSLLGNAKAMKQLLAAGIQVNSISLHGDTPLHFAVMTSQVEATELLIANGALVNVSNSYGDTPLHIACNVGDTDIIRLLLSHGADRTMHNDEGKPAFDSLAFDNIA
eukprot:TRINITY_DN25771_c0_g1_i1.p2 TRINITY_DN25771_c0_g1~~TRINITY_DN25771_c0_g1_i1.p2  ORF type:complete len:269 (+),score=90.49 TRINITY_DN25771_c0_g1_i1:1262-2068(+)